MKNLEILNRLFRSYALAICGIILTLILVFMVIVYKNPQVLREKIDQYNGTPCDLLREQTENLKAKKELKQVELVVENRKNF